MESGYLVHILCLEIKIISYLNPDGSKNCEISLKLCPGLIYKFYLSALAWSYLLLHVLNFNPLGLVPSLNI